MKTMYLLSFLVSLLFFNNTFTVEHQVQGKVTDYDGEPLIGASILEKGTTNGTLTDFDGVFTLQAKDKNSTLIISYTGFETTEILIDGRSIIDIELKEGTVLDEIVIKEYMVPLIKKDRSVSASVATMVDGIKMSKESTRAVKSTSPGLYGEEYSGDEIRAKVDGNVEIKSGQLTAAEWNDLHEWDKWESLVHEEDYKNMHENWGMSPGIRFSVFATNMYDMPLVDAEIRLLDKSGRMFWEARTDNGGKAELWLANDKRGRSEELQIEIEYDGTIERKMDAISIDKGVNHIRLDKDCKTEKNFDIAFVIDATGSMGDELEYLKAELKDVIQESKLRNKHVNLRLSSVVYRDSSDAYLTKFDGFTSNIDQSISFIQKQSAAGGGDYPEAVHAGLQEALMMDWSQSAVGRIIFMLLDAPPHKEHEILELYKEQVRLAASMGIKIIPIAASGINRQTEYLLKCSAIMTNGTYVFLTDDSGIGGPHLEHVTPDYDVEMFNDLLFRIITHYSSNLACEQMSIQNKQDNFAFEYYPNPARKQITIALESDIDELKICALSGQTLYKAQNLTKGKHEIDLNAFIDGVYLLKCRSGNHQVSNKLVISNNHG